MPVSDLIERIISLLVTATKIGTMIIIGLVGLVLLATSGLLGATSGGWIGGAILLGTLAISAQQFVFSLEARADRARRQGRLAEALRLYARAHQRKAIYRCIRNSMPDWAVRQALLDSARAVLDLEAGAHIARRAGVPASTTDLFVREARAAGDTLWFRAERIAAASALRVSSPRLRLGLEREYEKLMHLTETAGRTRAALAELMLQQGSPLDTIEHDIDRAALGLSALTEASKALVTSADEDFDIRLSARHSA